LYGKKANIFSLANRYPNINLDLYDEHSFSMTDNERENSAQSNTNSA
jgi:hypothetical protein